MVHDWSLCSCSSCVNMSCFKDQNRYNTCILQPSHLAKTTCDQAAAPCLLDECHLWVAQTPQTHLATVCAWDLRLARHTMHAAYPCLSTMPGHVFLWDLLCICDLLCSAHQQLSPTPSEQPLNVTWASCVPSDRQDISSFMSYVIFWVVGAPSQETVMEEKAWGSRERRVVLLHMSKQVCWNKHLEVSGGWLFTYSPWWA